MFIDYSLYRSINIINRQFYHSYKLVYLDHNNLFRSIKRSLENEFEIPILLNMIMVVSEFSVFHMSYNVYSVPVIQLF